MNEAVPNFANIVVNAPTKETFRVKWDDRCLTLAELKYYYREQLNEEF